MLKRFLIIFMMLFFTFEDTNASSVEIKAIVNGEVITSFDIGERVKLSKELLKLNKIDMPQEQIEANVLNEMIDDKIKIAEAQKYGIRIDETELKEAMLKMENYLKLPKGGYDNLIKKLGIKDSIVKKQVEADIIWMKFTYGVLRSYVKVSESEIDAFIDGLKENKYFKYDFVSFIKDAKDLKKYNSDLSKITKCPDFIDYAKKHGNSGSGLKISLKDVEMDKSLHSFFSRSALNKALPAIDINGATTIFFICDKQEYIPEITKEERENIRFQILQSKLDAYANKYFEKIKANSVIDIK